MQRQTTLAKTETIKRNWYFNWFVNRRIYLRIS